MQVLQNLIHFSNMAVINEFSLFPHAYGKSIDFKSYKEKVYGSN